MNVLWTYSVSRGSDWEHQLGDIRYVARGVFPKTAYVSKRAAMTAAEKDLRLKAIDWGVEVLYAVQIFWHDEYEDVAWELQPTYAELFPHNDPGLTTYLRVWPLLMELD